MQDSWLSKKAEEIQSFADRKDIKKFHDALKSSGTTLMPDKDAVFKRWAGHIVCAQSSINDNTNILPLVECNVVLDNSKLSLKQRTQFYKAGGQAMTEKPTELFHCM